MIDPNKSFLIYCILPVCIVVLLWFGGMILGENKGESPVGWVLSIMGAALTFAIVWTLL